MQVEAEKVGFYHIFKKVAFVEFRVQGPKKNLQRLGIFPGVPYHRCKMRVKVLYVSDHLEESTIFGIISAPLTLLAAGCPGPPGGLRGSFFRPWGSLSPQNTVKKPKSYLDIKFYVDSLKTG